MKTVVLVNQSVGFLAIDICNAFAAKYDKVILITGRISVFDRPLNSKVEVKEICRYNKSTLQKRIYTWIKGSLQIKNIVRKLGDEVDVLYFTNPPLSYMWADKLKQHFGIVEYDIYPDALYNIKCPKFIIKWWSKRNRSIFKKSLGIITLSEGMKEILSKYCPSEKIHVIHNWPTTNETVRIPDSQNKFVNQHTLQGKFVVMYAGNIGYTHNVETLIEVAERMSDNSSVAFVIIGQGGKKETLIKMVQNKGLTNVIFSDYLPAEDVKCSMSCANLGVVTLTKETAKVSVPSKTYNLLAYGIPLLNISTKDSELGSIIKKYNCGESFESNDIDGIRNYILECMSNSRLYEIYRANALSASKHFTYKNAERYTEIFK